MAWENLLVSQRCKWWLGYQSLTMDHEYERARSAGNYPPKLLLQLIFTTASSYYQSLTETECMHVATQRNGAFGSEHDLRSKYVARKLSQKLAEMSSLQIPHMLGSGPLKLVCNDLRPTNILFDDNMKIAAVIGWEFTYASPVKFTHNPPWWLLLDMPEEWPRRISNWIKPISRVSRPFFEYSNAKRTLLLQSVVNWRDRGSHKKCGKVRIAVISGSIMAHGRVGRWTLYGRWWMQTPLVVRQV